MSIGIAINCGIAALCGNKNDDLIRLVSKIQIYYEELRSLIMTVHVALMR